MLGKQEHKNEEWRRAEHAHNSLRRVVFVRDGALRLKTSIIVLSVMDPCMNEATEPHVILMESFYFFCVSS